MTSVKWESLSKIFPYEGHLRRLHAGQYLPNQELLEDIGAAGATGDTGGMGAARDTEVAGFTARCMAL